MVVVNGHDGPQSNAREIIDRSKKKDLKSIKPKINRR